MTIDARCWCFHYILNINKNSFFSLLIFMILMCKPNVTHFIPCAFIRGGKLKPKSTKKYINGDSTNETIWIHKYILIDNPSDSASKLCIPSGVDVSYSTRHVEESWHHLMKSEDTAKFKQIAVCNFDFLLASVSFSLFHLLWLKTKHAYTKYPHFIYFIFVFGF